MGTKYVLFIPQGGINDCFVQINKIIEYCIVHNRTLLLDFTNSVYKINFSDYFKIKYTKCNIIYNSNQIKYICINNKLTVYPKNLNIKLIDLFNKKNYFKYEISHYSCNNIKLDLPDNCNKDIILYSALGGGDGYSVFYKNIYLKNKLKEIYK